MEQSHQELSRLTVSQVSQLIREAGNPRNRALIALIYQAGLRRAEVPLLKRSGYIPRHKPGGPSIAVTRVKPQPYIQTLPIWKETAQLVEEYLRSRTDEDDALFYSRKHRPMNYKAVYHVYRNLAKKIGLPKELQHPHCLRHSIAAHLMKAGFDITVVQNFLGHIDAKGTVHYVQKAIDGSPLKLKDEDWSRAIIALPPRKIIEASEFQPFEES